MRRSNVRRAIQTMIVFGIIMALLSIPVAGAVSLNVDTQYRGSEANSQAISTTVQISPEGNPITDTTIQIVETDRGFVDTDSFTTTVDPSGADAEITYKGNGRFSIDELAPGETIQITFDAYPKTIKEESLHVTTISIEYVQQGQTLNDQHRVVADLSSSSYFKLQDAKNRLQQQQSLFYISLIIVGIVVLYGLYKLYVWWRGDDFESNDDGF